MKKIILTALISFCFSVFSFGIVSNDTIFQDIRKPLRVSGTKIYTENILHSEREVLDLLSISPDFVAQYQKGKNLRSSGTVLIVTGLVTFVGGMGVMVAGAIDSDYDYNYGSYYGTYYDSKYYIGLVVGCIGELLFDGGLLCKSVGKSYIRKSIANYNEAIKNTGYIPRTYYYQMGLLDNGHVGFKVTF